MYILEIYVTGKRSKKISSADIQYFSQNLQWCIFIFQSLPSSQSQPSGSSLHLAISVELKEQTDLQPGGNQLLIILNVWRGDSEGEHSLRVLMELETHVYTTESVFHIEKEWESLGVGHHTLIRKLAPFTK